jgi:hypothetical protein
MIMDICISEKKLEDYLFNHLNGSNVIKGVSRSISPVVDGCVYRQIDLGGYGIADLIAIDGYHGCNPTITIYELKKGEICSSALVQVLRYFAGIKKAYEWFGNYFQDDSVRCVLIGSSLSNQDGFSLSVSAIPFVDVYTYDLCPNTGLNLCYQEWEDSNETYPRGDLPNILTKFDYDTHDLEAMLHTYDKENR